MWCAHGQKQSSLFGMLPQEKSNSFPSSFCACLPKACSLQTRVRCPELFLSIEKFQPVWWRLTIPVKMKTASDFFCAEMWNNVPVSTTHGVGHFTNTTVIPFVPVQKRSSCCARHPTQSQCSVNTLTCPVRIFGNVASVCATLCGVMEIQVKLPYRMPMYGLHHPAGMELNCTRPRLALVESWLENWPRHSQRYTCRRCFVSSYAEPWSILQLQPVASSPSPTHKLGD